MIGGIAKKKVRAGQGYSGGGYPLQRPSTMTNISCGYSRYTGDVACSLSKLERHRTYLMICVFLCCSKLKPTPLLFMSSVSDETDSKFQSWLHANGLRAPKDFKFAFTSAQKASEACPVAPEAAANAWISISHGEVEFASSWALWIKSHHDTRGRMSSNHVTRNRLSKFGEASKTKRHGQIKVLPMIACRDGLLQKTPSALHYLGYSEVA